MKRVSYKRAAFLPNPTYTDPLYEEDYTDEYEDYDEDYDISDFSDSDSVDSS